MHPTFFNAIARLVANVDFPTPPFALEIAIVYFVPKIGFLTNLFDWNLGLVDNMSYFLGDDGKKYNIFGEGGVKRTAEEFEKEFLGEIPINPEVGKNGDDGKPIVEANPEHEISKIYLNFANKIKSTYL